MSAKSSDKRKVDGGGGEGEGGGKSFSLATLGRGGGKSQGGFLTDFGMGEK